MDGRSETNKSRTIKMNARANTPRRKGAFTLIELLVVIAIIALLVSILVPSLSAARELARRVACGSSSKSQGIGFNMYANDNQEWIPPWTFWFTDAANNPTYNWGWQNFIAPYADGSAKPLRVAGNNNVGITPSNNNYAYTIGSETGVRSRMMDCPSQKNLNGTEFMMRRGWAYKKDDGGNLVLEPQMPKITNWLPSNNKDSTKGWNPGELGLVFEAGYRGGDPDNQLGAGWDSIQWWNKNSSGIRDITIWATYRMPHINKTTNMLMLDGHVTLWTQAQIVARDFDPPAGCARPTPFGPTP
jgi:prepilin-type N-terminal cleavage/methylation domain-containing protein/prepilin-type processing-associated H-X9-DG protein